MLDDERRASGTKRASGPEPKDGKPSVAGNLEAEEEEAVVTKRVVWELYWGRESVGRILL